MKGRDTNDFTKSISVLRDMLANKTGHFPLQSDDFTQRLLQNLGRNYQLMTTHICTTQLRVGNTCLPTNLRQIVCHVITCCHDELSRLPNV